MKGIDIFAFKANERHVLAVKTVHRLIHCLSVGLSIRKAGVIIIIE